MADMSTGNLATNMSKIGKKTATFHWHFAVRFFSYVAIWISYLSFMASHAPRGIDWLPWHLQRIYNAVQYVKVNGYFSTYGFSIWSTCQDCGFSVSEWTGKIYLSSSAFKLFPHIFLNHHWGFEGLQKYGPQIDKFFILIGAIATAELIIICVQKYSSIPRYFVGILSFVVFTTAPWTYWMLIDPWLEVYFVAFFLLSMLFLSRGFNKLSFVMFFLAGLFHYQWAAVLIGLYCFLFLGSNLVKEDSYAKKYLPINGRTTRGLLTIVLVLIVALMFEIGSRLIAMQNLKEAAGSSLLFRMGISGDDIHNGSLLGALQFLGGIRVTVCFADYRSGFFPTNLIDGITRYNCILSIGTMFLLSLIAISGLIVLLKKSDQAKWIVFPLFYSLLVFITVLQQSLSVHLMGYSYIFSFLFATGIASFLIFINQYMKSITLRVLLSIPFVVGIVFASIRLSMLIPISTY